MNLEKLFLKVDYFWRLNLEKLKVKIKLMNRPQFVEGEIYHIYNRGVDKRKIFLGDLDYLRFIHDLFEFNDDNSSIPSSVRFSSYSSGVKDKETFFEVEPRKMFLYRREIPRKLLVNILAFSLMPNHFHLLLKEREKNGIVRFMQKLGTGYTMYFNKKQERVGSLFQGRFKAKLVDREKYLEYLLYYIHFNCLELIDARWSEKTIQDYQAAVGQLNTYRWSSHLDYAGKRNFPPVTQREFLMKIIGGEEEYKNTIKQWLKSVVYKMDTKEFKDLTMD